MNSNPFQDINNILNAGEDWLGGSFGDDSQGWAVFLQDLADLIWLSKTETNILFLFESQAIPGKVESVEDENLKHEALPLRWKKVCPQRFRISSPTMRSTESFQTHGWGTKGEELVLRFNTHKLQEISRNGWDGFTLNLLLFTALKNHEKPSSASPIYIKIRVAMMILWVLTAPTVRLRTFKPSSHMLQCLLLWRFQRSQSTVAPALLNMI